MALSRLDKRNIEEQLAFFIVNAIVAKTPAINGAGIENVRFLAHH